MHACASLLSAQDLLPPASRGCLPVVHVDVITFGWMMRTIIALFTAMQTMCRGVNGPMIALQVDKGLVPLPGSNNESWCQGLDGLHERTAEYYKAGARFAKWRSVVQVPAGPSMIAQRDCAYGLARYAKICQDSGLVPIVEPEVMLDGEHTIEETLEVACSTWAETFKYMADNKVMFEVRRPP